MKKSEKLLKLISLSRKQADDYFEIIRLREKEDCELLQKEQTKKFQAYLKTVDEMISLTTKFPPKHKCN